MANYIQYHLYPHRRDYLPCIDSAAAFGEFDDLDAVCKLSLKRLEGEIGSRVYLIVGIGERNPVYLLWYTFEIESFEEDYDDNGKAYRVVSGPGWMLNPPQVLEGKAFETFIKSVPPKFGFTAIDAHPFARKMLDLAEAYRRNVWDQETYDFCVRLQRKYASADPGALSLLRRVGDWINQEITGSSESEEAEEDDCTPKNQKQALEWVTRDIKNRRGQPRFRKLLMKAYKNQCALTGCSAVDALEAAHIVPFNGDVTNEVSNGLLLRADIHTLFDLDLLRIDPDTRKVVLADALLDTEYKTLNGHSLAEPVSQDDRPSRTSLKKRWESKKRIKLDG